MTTDLIPESTFSVVLFFQDAVDVRSLPLSSAHVHVKLVLHDSGSRARGAAV